MRKKKIKLDATPTISLNIFTKKEFNHLFGRLVLTDRGNIVIFIPFKNVKLAKKYFKLLQRKSYLL